MRKLQVHPEAVLSVVCEEIKEITPEIKALAEDMVKFVEVNNQGVAGLAAPQFGESVRMFAVNKSFLSEGHQGIFINPEIVDKQGEARGIEGCLSLPAGADHVTRAAYVQIKYQDLEGNTKVEEFGSVDEDADPRVHYVAAVFQHEMEHLDGKLFTAHLNTWNRKRVEKKSRKAYEKMKAKYFKALILKRIKEKKAMQKAIDLENLDEKA